MTVPTDVAVVVPTVGRDSLTTLLEALADPAGPRPAVVVLVDDRRQAARPLLEGAVPAPLADRLRVVRGHGAGPAAAREVGWRTTSTPWVAFLDDDVVPPRGWFAALLADLRRAGPDVGAVQGRLTVPLPSDRPATDWERNVAGLAGAAWATADMAYRREALTAVGGFDERLPRAYREDADLALRVQRSGWCLTVGQRVVQHPVRPTDRWVSWRLQRGNADDAFMAVRHGRGWRDEARVPRGRRPRHLATTAAGAVGLLALAAGRRSLAAVGLGAWAAGTAELATARILPGPRTLDEVTTMVATSLAIPPAATAWWLRGWFEARSRLARPGPDERVASAGSTSRPAHWPAPDAVLFDRDGTLIEDVPYNGDPSMVRLRPGAAEAVAHVRRAGIPVGIVTNQSGVARGLIDIAQARAVTRRTAELVGGVDVVEMCPHGPDDGCACRKPAPGMVHRAAERLGVEVTRCVVIGDIGADVDAARAAGARGILVPTEVTRAEEVERAAEVAGDLLTATAMALGHLHPAAGPQTADGSTAPSSSASSDAGAAGAGGPTLAIEATGDPSPPPRPPTHARPAPAGPSGARHAEVVG